MSEKEREEGSILCKGYWIQFTGMAIDTSIYLP